MSGRKSGTVGTLRHHRDEAHLLREVLRTYQVLMAVFSRQTGMPASRLILMRLLANSDKGIVLSEVARKLGVDRAAVTRQVQDMEAEKLLKRRQDSRDKRRCYITLTTKGRKRFEEVHERAHELERSLASELGAKEMTTAANTLSNLRALLEKLR